MTAGEDRSLASLAWPEVDGSSVLAIPLGSCEQHGPHLPLGTDTLIAAALAAALAERRRDVAVAPALAYGASGEHSGFAGTLSIGLGALETVVVELVRSAGAFGGTILLSAHGGNAAAVAAAMATLRAERRAVLAWSPPPPQCAGAGGRPPDAHAGWVETSVMLALEARHVRTCRLAAGELRPLAEILPALRSGGVASLAPNGVLGDPAGATAALGQAILATWVDDLEGALDRWRAPAPQ